MKTEHLFSGHSKYDPDRGVFTNNKGIEEGWVARNGYVYISLDGKECLAHRLIFFLENGEWPNEVDHINGIRHDNRRANLRIVTRSQNRMNSNASGIHQHSNGKWRVKIKIDGKSTHFGYYEDKELAMLVASEVKSKYFGEYARAV